MARIDDFKWDSEPAASRMQLQQEATSSPAKCVEDEKRLAIGLATLPCWVYLASNNSPDDRDLPEV